MALRGILRKGVNANLKDESGNCGLALALSAKVEAVVKQECLELLLEYNADPNLVDKSEESFISRLNRDPSTKIIGYGNNLISLKDFIPCCLEFCK